MRSSGLCVVHGCRGHRGHTFPQESVRLENWMKSLNWKHAEKPHKAAIVCRKHFRITDYRHQAEERTGPKVRKRWRLKKSAVPSVFESCEISAYPKGHFPKPKDCPVLIEVGDKEKSPLRKNGPTVRKRWSLKKSAVPPLFGSYEISAYPKAYFPKSKHCPVLIEVVDKEKSPVREVSFTVGELSFFLEDGVTESDVNRSILNALDCSSPTEDGELSAFSETVRSKLFDENEETPSISLPTAEGMLEITLKSALVHPVNYDSDSSEDGVITISRNYVGSDGSTGEDITIPLKNKTLSSEPGKGGYSSSERPTMPTVSHIIVFDANEEGVETMKSVLLAQMKNDLKPHPRPSSSIDIHPNVTVNHGYIRKHAEGQNKTEIITDGLNGLKLSPDTPVEPQQPTPISENKNLISAIRKSLPKVLVRNGKFMVIRKQSSGLNFVTENKNSVTTTPPIVDGGPQVLSTRPISTPLKGCTAECRPQFSIKSSPDDETAGGQSYIDITKKDSRGSACGMDIECGESLSKNHSHLLRNGKIIVIRKQSSSLNFVTENNNSITTPPIVVGGPQVLSTRPISTSHGESLSKSHSPLLSGLTPTNLSTITRVKPIDNSLATKTHETDAISELPNEPIKDQSDPDDDQSLDLHISLSSEAGCSDGDSSDVDVEEHWDGSRLNTPNVADSKQTVAADGLLTIDLDAEEETGSEGRPKSVETMNNVVKTNDIEEAEVEIPSKHFEVPSKISDVDLSKCVGKLADFLSCSVAPSMIRGSPEKTVDVDLSQDSETISCSASVLNESYESPQVDTNTVNSKVDQVLKDPDDDHLVCNLEKSTFIVDELPNAVEDSGDIDAVDPLGGFDLEGLNPKQSDAGGVLERESCYSDSGVMDVHTAVVVLDDAALQKLIHNTKAETDQQQPHNSSGCESAYVSGSDQSDPDTMSQVVQEDCLQFDIVENDSELLLDGVLLETEDSISKQVQMPKNVELDVRQSDLVLAPNLSTIITPYKVPQHLLRHFRKAKRPLKYKFGLPPPLIVPDHDYTTLGEQRLTSSIEKKPKKKNGWKLKPCSVVLDRLDPSVLAQYDSKREPEEDLLEPASPLSSSPTEPASPLSSSPTPTDNLICFHCSKVLPSKAMLCNHITSHHADNCVLCPHCGDKFKCIIDCNSHVGLCGCIIESRSSLITYLCPQCDFSTKDDSALRGHIDVNHRVQCNHSCSICPFKCVSEPALQNHIKRYHTPSTTVVSCSSVQSSSSLQSRLITVTSPSSQIQHPSDTSEYTIAKHKIHWNHPCSICQFKCMSEASLQNHMKCFHSDLTTSIEQTPTLLQPTSAITTSQIHLPATSDPTDKRYYKCLHCPFKCSSNEVFQQHNSRHHSESGNKLVKQTVEPGILTNQIQRGECAVQQPPSSVNQHVNNLLHVAKNIARRQINQNMLCDLSDASVMVSDDSTHQKMQPIPIRRKPHILRPYERVVQPRCSVQSARGTTAPRVMLPPNYAVRQPAQIQQKSKVKFLFPTQTSNDQFVPVVPALGSTPPPSPEMKPQAEIDLTDSVDEAERNSTQQTQLLSPSKLWKIVGIVCPQCNETKTSYADLGRHIIERHSKAHKCCLCPKSCTTRAGLLRHLNQKHTVSCPEGCEYVPKNYIHQHMMSAHRSLCFLCHCNFVTTVDSVMELHKMVMHKYMPKDWDTIRCPVCPPHTTNFKNRKALIDHANQRHYVIVRPKPSIIGPARKH